MRLLTLLFWLAVSSGFIVTPALRRPATVVPAGLAVAPAQPHALAATVPTRTAVAGPRMGLFGLGWGEIGIIGVVALFILGPDKLVPMAKDLGKSASSLKEVTDSFAEGMAEGNAGIASPKTEDLKSAQDGPTVTVKEEA